MCISLYSQKYVSWKLLWDQKLPSRCNILTKHDKQMGYILLFSFTCNCTARDCKSSKRSQNLPLIYREASVGFCQVTGGTVEVVITSQYHWSHHWTAYVFWQQIIQNNLQKMNGFYSDSDALPDTALLCIRALGGHRSTVVCPSDWPTSLFWFCVLILDLNARFFISKERHYVWLV